MFIYFSGFAPFLHVISMDAEGISCEDEFGEIYKAFFKRIEFQQKFNREQLLGIWEEKSVNTDYLKSMPEKLWDKEVYPRKVWEMLRELVDIADATPNPGHKALAKMEEAGILKGIITQNIDMLHQKAGSRTVVEFHGSISMFTCLECMRKYSLTDVRHMKLPPQCESCSAILKPDIVFFDEQIPPLAIQQTDDLLQGADVLLVAGTSCQVMPASMIPNRVYQSGGKIIEINLEPALQNIAQISLASGFSKTMTALADALCL